MAAPAPRTLFGTTDDQGCVPSADGNAGPVYSEDGRLIVAESWTTMVDVKAAAAATAPFVNDFLLETWRIWDCCRQSWAPCNVTLYRYESADLVVRTSSDGATCCAWTGAVNTQSRILASLDPDECLENCWQWLRA